jgi:hypothetical protein
MPIRLNLLAEAQALEEMRRRDPVKRAILAGIGLVLVMLTWSGSIQLKAMMARSELNGIERQLKARDKDYKAACEAQRKLADTSYKLQSLSQLATNRLLYGTLLNALQQSMIDDIQVVRFKADQGYVFTPEVKPKTNDDNIVPGKPATSAEHIILTVEAHDTGPNPGDQVNKYKQAIADLPYFQAALTKTNEVRLVSLSPPQIPAGDGKPFVLFTLECRFPEHLR